MRLGQDTGSTRQLPLVHQQVTLHDLQSNKFAPALKWKLMLKLICLTSKTIPTGWPECVDQQKWPLNPIRFHLMDINGSPKVDLFQ